MQNPKLTPPIQGLRGRAGLSLPARPRHSSWVELWSVLLVLLVGSQAAGWADASLVFNEIMYHPATEEPLMEWVELHNQMAVDLDVSGWSMDGGIGFVFGSNTVVRGGGYVVVASSPATLMARTGLTNVFGPFTNRLSNSGEHLRLRNNNGRVVSELDYGVGGDWPVAPDGSGVSLAKLDESLASKPARNWTWSAQMGGSPGAKNFPTAPALTPLAFNELAAATNTDFWLEIANWGTNPVSLTGYVIVHDGTTNAEYVFPSATSIPAGNWLAVSNSALGFTPRAKDKLWLLPPARDRVVDAVELKDSARARFPNGLGEWHRPAAPTPGAANAFAFHDEVVINEIMYHHQRPAATNDLPAPPSDEEWLELYNRGTNSVDLSGWTLAGAIAFQFPPGKTLAPGAFLVVARNAQALSWLYPAIDIIGDYTGQLANDGDTLLLKDSAGNPADEVRYYTSGRWPVYADGGGSSLELRDPWADNSKAEAWAASDETARAGWHAYSYQAVAQTRWFEPSQWKDFIVGLLEAGECLLDDLSVVEIQGANRTQRLVNGNFENGATGWRVLGTHGRSRVIADPDNSSNHVLHLLATGPQEHMHNHVESTLNDGGITDGLTYEISFRAKWLAGGKLLNTRLFFNRVARTTTLLAPQLSGTPGAPNSRYETNIGPTFLAFQHQPVVPSINQPVTVSVTPQDPQGVVSCELWWSVNSGAFSHATMTAKGDGRYEGTIPAAAAGKIVQFYVKATDSLGATAAFPAAGPDSGALYMVADGQAQPTLGHNFRLIFTPANWALLRAVTNLMSNATLPCTLIYNEQRPYYDIRALLKGSQSGRPADPRPSFNVKFQPDDRFRGVHPVLLMDCSGPPGTANHQQEILAHHMLLHAGGIPGMQPDLGWLIPPFQTNTGPAFVIPRHEDEFIETAFDNGGDGAEWSFELIYTPTTTNSAGYKLPNPQILLGVDLQDLGDDKEAYRYNYILKYHRGADDFRPVMTLAKTMELPSGPLLDAQAHLLMDLNEWLRTLAFVSLCGESDWYSFSNPHNFNLYQRPSDGRLVMLPWDVEHLYLRSSTAPLLGTAAPYWTDLARLPGNKRRLYGHAQDMIQSTFNTAYMTYWANHYSRFAPGQDFTELLPKIQARAAAVLAEINAAGGNAPFAILGTNYIESSNSVVTLSGTAPVQVHTLRINGVEYPVTWTTISNWTVMVAVTAPTTPLYIAGYDLWGNALTNSAASVTVRFTGTPPHPAGKVIFSEILFQPLIPGAAWVELQNTSASTFDLSGWRIEGLAYTFPAGTLLTNGQFLVLAEEGNAFLSVYGTNVTPFDLFAGKLQTNGETLTLLMPGALPNSEVVVDRVRYSALPPWPAPTPGLSLQVMDVAQDNSCLANWGLGAPTPGRSNALAQTLPPFPDLWINELQPENLTGITNRAGQRTAWIELYNAASNSVSLEGLYLTDSYAALMAWPFPTGATLGPGQFKVLFADGLSSLSSSNEWHTTFSLAPGHGAVALSRGFNGQPQVLDFLDYTNIVPNRSYGSVPDGQGFDRRELYYVTPGATNNGASPPLNVFINEWMAANSHTIPNPISGAYSDWFELYNASTNAADLGGFYLTDNLLDRFKHRIPNGCVIPPLGYLLVWADGRNTNGTPDLHVSFKMNKDGESLGLYGADGNPVDFVFYGPQTADVSEGRYPDGPGSRYFMPLPTPRAANVIPNTPPVLAEIGTRYTYSGQWLRFTASATDAEAAYQTLSFSLEPGAPQGAAIGVANGVFVWLADVPPWTTNTATVRVTDSGQPPLSDTATFAICVLPLPQLQMSMVNGNGWTISFPTLPSQIYQIEYKGALAEPAWSPLTGPMPGDGTLFEVHDPSPNAQRYYRLVVLPSF
jgi:hypothetical protein